jgi:AMP phosphorylase
MGNRKGRRSGLIFKIKLLRIEAGGKPIAIMDDDDAKALGIHPLERVDIYRGDVHALAIVNIAKRFPRGFIGVYDEVLKDLDFREGESVDVRLSEDPISTTFIKEKIYGQHLNKNQIESIIYDVANHHLSDIELAAFVTALQINGTSLDEVEAISRAMVTSGKTLDIGRKPILDKHSIGGVPGDKTTLLVVPIIAAANYVIPKTSSRAITSPAGTADRVEVLCPVNLSQEEILETIRRTNACMVWGGSLDLAPVDDLLIQVEHPLSIDPLLLPSIMSKKKAVGAEYLVIDIPTGRNAKIKTMNEAESLARDFIDLGKRLDIKVECAVTSGEQPIGHAVGPALEAKEALETLMGEGPTDLLEKAGHLAGILLEMVGVKRGKEEAARLVKTGAAERKLREIIKSQGGNPVIKPGDIKIGDKTYVLESSKRGVVLGINTSIIAQIAKAAGAPRDKGAGVLVEAKLGYRLDVNSPLLRIFSESSQKLEHAINLAKTVNPIQVSERIEEEILLNRIPALVPKREEFPLER